MGIEKKYDVTALGELLIDFTESGLSEQGNKLLEVNPGGAPCNVLAMLNKAGRKVAFIGKVGKGSHTYLMSPMAAMASALRGEITDPRDILGE